MEKIEHLKNSKFIFIAGIGGSDLAGKAVWSATSLYKNINSKVLFLESLDLREKDFILNIIEKDISRSEEVAFLIISKSGETSETLEVFNNVFEMLFSKFGEEIKNRIVVVSLADSKLWKLAEEKNIEKLAWQAGVGGRFSAFTVPHLAILNILGLDFKSFVEGGKEMAERCEQETLDNPARNLAKNIFENYDSKDSSQINILDLFFFNLELEDLGKWSRQLIAESLGKENKKGKRVGITPTVSLGPIDLHSMLQLNLGGPRNRFTIFIKSEKEIENTITKEAYENTIKAYTNSNLPFEKYEMPEINEKEIGKFMALMMETTLELALLLEVDPYNQPEVEEYKNQIKKIEV